MLRDMPVLEQYQTFNARKGYRLAKRLLDLAICLVCLPVAILIMAITAIVILLDSGPPILFIQERIGRHGRRFRLYKFRTLKGNYDDSAGREFMQAFVNGQIGRNNKGRAVYKPFDKSQITRVGRFLRRSSLDELPQIFNVLRGEMSLVGPRPNVPWEVAAYHEWHKERLKALPGITGLAQVRGRSGISFDFIVAYDIDYISHQSLWLDLQILWWTVCSISNGRGAG